MNWMHFKNKLDLSGQCLRMISLQYASIWSGFQGKIYFIRMHILQSVMRLLDGAKYNIYADRALNRADYMFVSIFFRMQSNFEINAKLPLELNHKWINMGKIFPLMH